MVPLPVSNQTKNMITVWLNQILLQCDLLLIEAGLYLTLNTYITTNKKKLIHYPRLPWSENINNNIEFLFNCEFGTICTIQNFVRTKWLDDIGERTPWTRKPNFKITANKLHETQMKNGTIFHAVSNFKLNWNTTKHPIVAAATSRA